MIHWQRRHRSFIKCALVVCGVLLPLMAEAWVAPRMRRQTPKKPTSNLIASDVPLMAVSLSASTGIYVAPPGGSASGTGNLATAATGVMYTGTGMAPTGTALVTAGSGSTALAPTSLFVDATTGFSAAVSVTVAFPSYATPACSVLAPFAALPCAIPSFAFPSTDMTNGSLQVRASATNGTALDFLNSNILPVSKFVVKQITNTKNNNAASDDIIWPVNRTTTIYGGKLHFHADPAASANGKTYTFDGTTLARFPYFIGETSGEGWSTLHPVDCNGLMYFGNRNSTAAVSKVFSTDGTTVQQVSNSMNDNTQSEISAGQFGVCLNNKLFTALRNTNGVAKLYSISGTTITQLSNLKNDNTVADAISYYIVYGNKIYFQGHNGTYDYYVYDDGDGSITRFSDTYPSGADGASGSVYFFIYNGKLFFNSNNASARLKLYSYDGSVITPISNTAGTALNDTAMNHFIFNNKLYFSSLNASGVRKLYEYDDVAGTLKQISNISGSAALDDAPASLASHNSKLFFTAKNASGYEKVYSYDGTVIQQISNTAGSSATDAPTSLTVYNNKLYFSANNASAVKKLYVYDDPSNFLAQVSNTTGSTSVGDDPFGFVIFGTRMYFGSNLSAGVNKLFRICDLSAGCSD